MARPAQYGWEEDGYDALIQTDISQRDGYRDYNESRRVRVGGNLGRRLNENVNIRFFADYTDLGFDVSGPLTAQLLNDDPEAVFSGPTISGGVPINPGPNVIRDRPRRDTEQVLVGSRATAAYGANIVDLAFGYTRTDDSFRFPISASVRETEGDDVTGVLRYAYRPDEANILSFFEATAQYVRGSADRDYYLNLSGMKGAPFGSNTLDAETLSFSAGFHIPIGGAFTVSPSVAYSHSIILSHGNVLI